MVHAGYCGYWWELYRTVTEAAPTKTLLMDDDLGDLVRVSEQIAGSAEVVGIDSTAMVQFIGQAEDLYYGTGTAMPTADPALEVWLTRVRLALAERERTNTSPPPDDPTTFTYTFPSPTSLPPTPPAPFRPFEFSDFNKPPVVNGKTKKMLTQAEHDILMALQEAGPRGLTKDELDAKSGHTEARKYLRKLASDPDWASVILFPEQKGRGGYRLRLS